VKFSFHVLFTAFSTAHRVISYKTVFYHRFVTTEAFKVRTCTMYCRSSLFFSCCTCSLPFTVCWML